MSEVNLRVSAGSEVNKVAGAIAKNVGEAKQVRLSAIGAGAVNQAVKAMAVAKMILRSSGVVVYFDVSFDQEIIDGMPKTIMCFFVKVV